jgi:hypothetical protein
MAEAAKKELAPSLRVNQIDIVKVEDDDFFADGLDTGMEGIDSADVALPRLSVLQGLSPQLNQRKDEYIKEAKMGDIVNLGTGKIMSNPYPLVVAKYERRYVEWSPRDEKQVCPLPNYPKVFGKGLIRDWGADPRALESVVRDDDTGRLWTKEGNEMLPTATYYCVDPETLTTFFIPMARTQFTASKKIISKIRDEKVNRGGTLRTAPTFWRIWEFTTSLRQRDNNEWFIFDARPGQLLKDHPNGSSVLGVIKDFQESLRTDSYRLDMGEEPDAGGGAGSYIDSDAVEM